MPSFGLQGFFPLKLFVGVIHIPRLPGWEYGSLKAYRRTLLVLLKYVYLCSKRWGGLLQPIRCVSTYVNNSFKVKTIIRPLQYDNDNARMIIAKQKAKFQYEMGKTMILIYCPRNCLEKKPSKKAQYFQGYGFAHKISL